jgi:cytochrome d ubiquinol oxidase subunit I
VLAVNSWMNDPGSFTMRPDGTVTDIEPVKALFGNGHIGYELVHMYLAGFIVTGFLVAGAYAAGRLRGRWGRYERIALTIPLTVAALAAPVQVVVGDWAAREVAKTQPVKLAALEGLGRTERGAALHLGGWYAGGEVKGGIAVPKGLSLLAFHDPEAKVLGLDSVPPADRPPVNVVRISFQLMVSIGTFLAALSAWYLFMRVRRKRSPEADWFYRLLVIAGPLSVVALISGWVTTEVGRQPWVVYEVMRTTEAVTAAKGIPLGYATLATFYACLVVAVAWILRRLARAPMQAGPEPEPEHQPAPA